ncbi:hypothetical protein D3C86_1366590 [compost metagenome]
MPGMSEELDRTVRILMTDELVCSTPSDADRQLSGEDEKRWFEQEGEEVSISKRLALLPLDEHSSEIEIAQALRYFADTSVSSALDKLLIVVWQEHVIPWIEEAYQRVSTELMQELDVDVQLVDPEQFEHSLLRLDLQRVCVFQYPGMVGGDCDAALEALGFSFYGLESEDNVKGTVS